MTRIEEMIVKWNGGKKRGAARKFALKLGITPSYMSRLVNGLYTSPKPQLLAQMSAELNATAEELERVIKESDIRGANVKAVGDVNHRTVNTGGGLGIDIELEQIRVYGKVTGGTFRLELSRPTEDTLPIPQPSTGTYKGFKVQGSDLEDFKLYHGDGLVVEMQSWAVDGELVLAKVQDEEYMIKRYDQKNDKGLAVVGVCRRKISDL